MNALQLAGHIIAWAKSLELSGYKRETLDRFEQQWGLLMRDEMRPRKPRAERFYAPTAEPHPAAVEMAVELGNAIDQLPPGVELLVDVERSKFPGQRFDFHYRASMGDRHVDLIVQWLPDDRAGFLRGAVVEHLIRALMRSWLDGPQKASAAE